MLETQKVESELRNELVGFPYPVCRKSISKSHLLDVESVITDGLHFAQKTYIANSKVVLRHKFTQYYDEKEDIDMEECHSAIAVISVEINGKRDVNCHSSVILSGKEDERRKEDEIMHKGKALGQNQTILDFVESGHDVTTKRMCEIFSAEGEIAKKEFRKLEAVNSMRSTVNNKEMNLACSFSRHEIHSG